MCGRYTITVSMEELMRIYNTPDMTIVNYAPKYNAAPTQYIPAVIGSGPGNRIGQLRWGLVPSWAKDDKSGGKMINIRAETLTSKPSFRRLLSSRRCVIPADGFYEWQNLGSAKQPMRILMRDGSVFSMAGIYDIWVDTEGKKLATCSIITTEPNELTAEIHNRMPVILRPEAVDPWLDRSNQDADRLAKLLKPYDPGEMRAYPVSAKVGNVRNDSRDLIDEVQP
ncbi:putative SOS response-associated peptidase YedK [Paenibacillus forsythiae]|uniref:Abasic site processing protein n=2 Tax=Paenibacillus forsythiae TaxID=365616 RepID=A0ABU3H6F3_9BACL|nr:SOS response-associated peptidase [Paenibacillus forsythiae]MDT3426379.1 putative SOS response-associated peptidase YedK [Paenibacillus forsythiae]